MPAMTLPKSTAPIEKRRLRGEALARRATQPNSASDERIAELGQHLVPSPQGQIISGYMPIRGELSPIILMTGLRAGGAVLALPVVERSDAPLLFRAWSPGDRLIAVKFGLHEPAPQVPAVLPTVLLVPLAAFDAEGYRIGYGGGYYDRTLELYRASRKVTAIGIAYDCQEVPVFGHEPHDQQLDYILTPSGVRKFGS